MSANTYSPSRLSFSRLPIHPIALLLLIFVFSVAILAIQQSTPNGNGQEFPSQRQFPVQTDPRTRTLVEWKFSNTQIGGYYTCSVMISLQRRDHPMTSWHTTSSIGGSLKHEKEPCGADYLKKALEKLTKYPPKDAFDRTIQEAANKVLEWLNQFTQPPVP